VDSPLAWPETPVAVRTLLSVLFNTVNPDVPLVPDDPEDPLDPEVPEDPEPASSITFITGPSDSPNWKLLPLTVIALSEYVYVPAANGVSITSIQYACGVVVA
jgi:hypothetical protein